MARKLQLTFDDGPDPVAGALVPILEEVERRGVVAAFFVLGQEVKANPAGTMKIVEKHHVLGNHSFDHLTPDDSNFTDAQIVEQFRKTHDEVKAATQVVMKHWRAPRLDAIQRLTGLLVGPGKLYTLSHCDVHGDSKDADGVPKTPEQMVASITVGLNAFPQVQKPRLLFHIKEDTAGKLKKVLDLLAGQGHTFVDFAQSS